jgi:hypothetical protein
MDFAWKVEEEDVQRLSTYSAISIIGRSLGFKIRILVLPLLYHYHTQHIILSVSSYLLRSLISHHYYPSDDERDEGDRMRERAQAGLTVNGTTHR